MPPQSLVTSSSLFYRYITRNNSLSPVPGLNLDSPVKVKEADRKSALKVTKNDFLPAALTVASARQYSVDRKVSLFNIPDQDPSSF